MLIEHVKLFGYDDRGVCTLETEEGSSIVVNRGHISVIGWPNHHLEENRGDRSFFNHRGDILYLAIKNRASEGYTDVPLAIVPHSDNLRMWLITANASLRPEPPIT